MHGAVFCRKPITRLRDEIISSSDGDTHDRRLYVIFVRRRRRHVCVNYNNRRTRRSRVNSAEISELPVSRGLFFEKTKFRAYMSPGCPRVSTSSSSFVEQREISRPPPQKRLRNAHVHPRKVRHDFRRVSFFLSAFRRNCARLRAVVSLPSSALVNRAP